jgi:hypothetical protein
VPPRLLMCLTHWRLVPRSKQIAVYKAYRPGQEVTKDPSEEYLAAAKAAIAAVAHKELLLQRAAQEKES